jgi:histidinol phosphatase-like PHP family hydrolase
VTRWTPIDCHAHTTMSDGELTIPELIAVVRARGVRPSISDHISTDVSSAVKTVEGVRDYLDALELYDDVARGGEFCWHDSLWRELPDALTARFTHRIGSLHAVHLPGVERPLSMFHRTLPDGLSPVAYMAYHLDELERFAAEMPVDILAHPTLLPLPMRTLPVDELWTDALEERLVDALWRAGIAFEISARYRPHERLVRRAHDRGVRLSLGSDGHTAAQAGDLSFPLAMARLVGAKESALFDPFVHGMRVTR